MAHYLPKQVFHLPPFVMMGLSSPGVQAKLKGVTQIHSTHTAFAAIVLDGSVVAWGDPIVMEETARWSKTDFKAL